MTWIRKVMPYLGVLIVAALLYDGYVFYSRWSFRREAVERQANREAEARKTVVAELGGEGMKILSFYAAPSTIHRGEQTTLCYGVAGAKSVKLEPAVDDVWPALTRCVKAYPTKDTVYRFTTEDGAGHTASQSVGVKVR